MPRSLPFTGLFLALLALLLLPQAESTPFHTTPTETPPITTIGPVIGVVAQPKHSSLSPCDGECEYIAASYVKWVESAGGRALPIPYDASPKDLDIIFASVNGLLFPGGSSLISKGTKYLFAKARQANEMGDFFPVWGTCLGLEWMVEAVCAEAEEQDPSLPHFLMDNDYDAWNLTLPLLFTDTARTSQLFQGLQPSLLSAASEQNLTMNNHHKGVAPTHLAATPALASFFDVLSTNLDRAGVAFVSTVEGKDGMPFYGVQFHPEKAMFEWGVESEGGGEGGEREEEGEEGEGKEENQEEGKAKTEEDGETRKRGKKEGGKEEGQATTVTTWPYEAINHSPAAQALSRYLAEFFIGEARKNGHVFPEERAGEVLTWAYPVVWSGPEFVQSYFFREYAFPGGRGGGEEEGEEEGGEVSFEMGVPALRGAKVSF